MAINNQAVNMIEYDASQVESYQEVVNKWNEGFLKN